MTISPINSNTPVVGVDRTPGPVDSGQNIRLAQAIRQINNSNIFSPQNELTFILDRTTRRPITRVVNRDTHEVVAQLPPEYVLQLASELQSGSKGVA